MIKSNKLNFFVGNKGARPQTKNKQNKKLKGKS